ncbi:hypothetical protein C8N43_2780 [Litoreibacter ponti]|uniref:Aminoglycoside phosphotransferase domain-containing protein n=1 Tax=Litoreibacter ponti TaxID=1510457 RepID=A0A2T6BPZ5_9RHOB|nr:phosphotransferase [Litoreibacter ponti]PTX58104.1 hypothetical protein C8N43_2780 [Litoreibacter ponti]
MIDRDAAAQHFLDQTDWQGGTRRLLAGDASNRRYERISHPDRPSVVLMDAPPEKGEDTRPFVKIARHLSGLGLSAPRVYAADEQRGFLLIEDLGDALFARVLEHHPEREPALYEAAMDALIVAQTANPPGGLKDYGPQAMTDAAMLVPEWYIAATGQNQFPSAEYRAVVADLLQTHLKGSSVLVQRDYHAENLLWLPDREGVARVGLLDFQDAMLGHPAYDLASLLKDLRRDVSQEVQDSTLQLYITRTKAEPTQFRAAYAACSAQRNLRVLGVFTRLCVRDGKTSYPDLLIRLWRNLRSDLAHPALAELKQFVHAHIPEPTPQVIARIKDAANG